MTLIDPHLDVNQLSAAVDGDLDPTAGGHLRACPACREEVAVWRRRLAGLADPEAPAEIDDAAIAAAMAAWDPPAPAAARPIGVVTPRRRRAVAPGRLAAAVVAAVLVAGAVALAVTHTGGTASRGASATASRPPGPSHAASGATGQPASAPMAGSHPDLGAVATTATLTSDLRSALRRDGTRQVAAGTPCLARAEQLDGPAAPVFEASLRFDGTAGRVFVFGQSGAFVAVVLGTHCVSLSSIGF